MNIGELKHRITIEQCTKSSDGQGGFTSAWSTLVSVWSKATPQSERERFYRGENQHTQGYTFTIRQNQAVTVPATRDSDNIRIVHRNEYYRITGISRNKDDLDFYDIKAELWGAVAQ